MKLSTKGKGSGHESDEATRDMYLGNAEFSLEKGEYYIIAEVDWI